MSALTYSPEANYLSRTNIVHQGGPAVPAAEISALEARARTEFAVRTGATLTGGSIKKGAS
jgi:hypothetical protein